MLPASNWHVAVASSWRRFPGSKAPWGSCAKYWRCHHRRRFGWKHAFSLESSRRLTCCCRGYRNGQTFRGYEQVSIERRIAEAWTTYADGKKDDALTAMRAAADLDDATEKHPVTPGNILPAREQLGDMLLEAGRPADALVEYEASLKRAPRRLAGLYGAAHSAKLAGDVAKASRYYAELADVTKGGEGKRAEVVEAREAVKLAAR